MYDVLFAWSRVRRTERIVRQTWCLRSRRSMSTRWPRRLTSAYARTERRWPLAIRSVTIGVTRTFVASLGTFCQTARYSVLRRGRTSACQTLDDVVVRATVSKSVWPYGRA